ncbi:MAG: type II toxin-antitoxin system VapC family toxin [Caldiserica bacterium]|nr:type II toxin-antitoxin system VapC family toxin [Caldisericota bacterium]
MKYTLDTNILVYAADRSFPLHRQAVRLRDRAVAERGSAFLCFPVLLEFFAVVTDPARVRAPLNPDEAWKEVNAYADAFHVVYPDERTLGNLSQLIAKHRVARQNIFDALIVALMLQHGIEGIYTANRKDFARFPEIEVLPWPE